ncbi:vinorine synthase-like [Neltuma alba]|uniref:vinorine synthase-like n=1 Tax=Neltuma alba TaxID=207710 RepID=UPI0010A3DE09|nr:vinorine synthase-like [Prosopis alba]
MAKVKVEIVSQVTIKPLSPTPNHLKHFQISLLDEIATPSSFYLLVVLFYFAFNHIFPNCRVPSSKLSDFLKDNTNQQLNEIKGFLPLDPYKPKLDDDEEDHLIMAVHVIEFGCGGKAIGVCISHKVCDTTSVASFLKAWSQKAMGEGSEVASSSPLNMEAYAFSAQGLKEEISSRGCSFKSTRIEAVTTFIWKSALEAVRTTEPSDKSSSFLLHAVNIRSRMFLPLPENSLSDNDMLHLFMMSHRLGKEPIDPERARPSEDDVERTEEAHFTGDEQPHADNDAAEEEEQQSKFILGKELRANTIKRLGVA